MDLTITVKTTTDSTEYQARIASGIVRFLPHNDTDDTRTCDLEELDEYIRSGHLYVPNPDDWTRLQTLLKDATG